MIGRLVATTLFVVGAGSCADPLPPPTPDGHWSVGGSSAGTPAFDDLLVFFLTRDHRVAALVKRTGAVRWRAETGMTDDVQTSGSRVLVVGDAVIVGDSDIHAFSRTTGARLWQFHAQAGYLPGLFDLATDGTRIFAGSPSGHVYAISAQGQEVWRIHLKDSDLDQSAYSPVYAEGRVYVCLKRFAWPRTGGLAALDAVTGTLLWRREFPAKPPFYQNGCLGQLAVTGGVVVGASEDGNIYAYDRITGEASWSAPQLTDSDGTTDYMDTRHIAAGEGVVVVGSNTGWVVGLDAGTGEEVWRTSIGFGSISFPLAVAGGTAYAVGGALELIAYDLATGRVRWFRGRNGLDLFTPRPVLDGDQLFVGGPGHMSSLSP